MDGQARGGNGRAERERTSQILRRFDPTGPNPQPVFYQQDHEGSVTYLTYDAPSGQTPILEYYRYDVFGQPAIYSPDNQVRQASLYSNRFLFTGREYNANFGFYEYRARAYHPGLGRFMSEDPKLFDAGDYNLFRYCHNDPIDNVDPMGLADEKREPWYNHEEQAKQLAKLQDILNQKLLLGYGAISVGGLQYALTQLQQTMGDTTNFHMGQVSVAGREGKGSESWRNAQAQAILDKWAGLAYESRKEVAGTLNSSGQAIPGPERDRYPTKSNPGAITADTIATWHFHHLLPRTAPYKFSYPYDERMIQAHPNLSHYVGVLNAPAGQFTIFAYTPETPWLHYIRLGPQPFPQPPSY